MKAIAFTKYGSPDVLQQTSIDKPLPRDNEILISVHATSVNFGDTMARNFKAISPRQFNMLFLFWLVARISFGLSQPKITVLGNEFAGEIEAVGKNVKKFKQGNQVFGYTGERMGAYAEYLCIPENGILAIKPTNMTFEEAAVVPYGALMALSLLRRANIQPGQKVLINGASGGIGSAAVQIATSLGAEVTGVCSTSKVEFVKSIGAAKVIDYTNEDFTQNGETYDLIFDILGRSSFSCCKSSLKPKGIHLFASFKMKQLLQMLWTSRSGGQKVICALGPGSVEDLHSVKELIEAGKIKAVIDSRFPLEQTAEAHRYVEKGHKTGGIVINVKEIHKTEEEKKASNAAANRYIAYCGNDCTVCPQYKQNCLEGCLGDACAEYCGTCAVRNCNQERGIANCAQCEEYPCPKLEKQFENMAKDGYGEWAVKARKVLEVMRRFQVMNVAEASLNNRNIHYRPNSCGEK